MKTDKKKAKTTKHVLLKTSKLLFRVNNRWKPCAVIVHQLSAFTTFLIGRIFTALNSSTPAVGFTVLKVPL